MRSGLFLFAVFLIFFITSCNSPKLWGLSKDEFFHALEQRNYGFLDSVDPARYDSVLTFGDEAPWCLGLHLGRAGRTEEARAMLAVGAKESPEPYRSLCAEALVRTGTPQERLDSAESLLAANPEGPGSARLANLRFSLLLAMGRFDEVYGPNPEITAIRSDVWRKSWKEAWAKASVILDASVSPGKAPLRPDVFSARAVLSDFCKAALYGSAKPEAAAKLFDRLAARATREGNKEAQYILAFYAGRLYGSGSAKAFDRFASALPLAQLDSDYDNALWYLFDSALASGTESFLSAFARYAPTWKNGEYFDDIIEPFIVREVRDRDWKGILSLRDALPSNIDRDIKARLDYLAARSNHYDSEATNAAYRSAFAADRSSLYYRVLSSEALALTPESDENFFSGLKRKASSLSTDAAKAQALRSLLSYHLEEMVYPIAESLYPDCPPELARELASALSAMGRYGDAIRIVLLAIHSSDAPITKEDLEFIYPRPWHDEVAAAATRFGIPEYVLYALIRSESYFQNDAVSGVGAQGLTQLMRPTAADIARKLKLDSFDLADPATNISFGSYYLSELASRLDGNMMSALYAYNAGITKVRLWLKDAGYSDSSHPDGDLVLEGLPYAETREYGRKVLAAAAVYGYLYYQKTPGQVVRELF